MEYFLLSLLGLIIASFSGILGIGGGAMTVPALFYISLSAKLPSEHSYQLAIACSLVMACIISISASLSNLKSKRVNIKLGLLFSAGTIPGALLGTRFVGLISSENLALMFSVVLLGIGFHGLVKILKTRRESGVFQKDEILPEHKIKSPTLRFASLLFAGLVTGILASMTGTGGGIIMVPLFVRMTNMDIHNSIATSSFCIIFNSFFAVLAYSFITPAAGFPEPSLGYFYFPYLIPLLAGGLVGGYLGAKMAGRMSSTKLTLAFVILQILIGGKMLFDLSPI